MPRFGTRRWPTGDVAVHAVVILTIAVLVGGSWWFAGRHLTHFGAPDEPPVGEDGRFPGERLAIAEFGGAKDTAEDVRYLDDLAATTMLTPAELRQYDRGETGRVRLRIARFDHTTVTALLAELPQADEATARAHALAELQLSYGFEVPVDAPAGVTAHLAPDVGGQHVGRAHYAGDGILVRIDVRGAERARVHQRLMDTVDEQVKAVRPDA
ncbi:hypothetical protein [Haloechinothrix sp. LS1_15]|uniref:hypothetical protein n=1 Tax=Haloechinothrix sp. LS1_15 TaxID=2652248 RepID=UPI002946C454|nr:hypothetical protein [Haloechinothrix sp. LS1_15]MDV6014551.1 hypothetical protein [Haloechinothrix sp. LS1_15]